MAMIGQSGFLIMLFFPNAWSRLVATDIETVTLRDIVRPPRDKNASWRDGDVAPGGGGALVMTATQLCTAMLPILRVLTVGGVLLAILILVLALTPPDGSRGPLSSPGVPARGVLSDRDRQAETRQFLIHAALKRADQLSRLRDLPDTRAHSEEPKPELAGLPAERSDADPEESGSINETPANAIPIEIGGPSIEVPIPPPQDTPLTKTRPEQSKAQRDTRRRMERPRRTTVTRTQSR